MVDAIILAGGLGTRLREVVTDRPKPLADIAGRPFLDRLLEKIASFGCITRAILAIGYRSELIIDHYSKTKAPLPLDFSIEKDLLGTGGALKLALERVRSDDVLVLNGDTYLDIFLPAFLDFHREKRADLSLATLKVEGDRYGAISFDPSTKRLLSFSEKDDTSIEKWISGGVYLLKKELLHEYPLNQALSLEKDIFPKLLKKNSYAFPLQATFIDIGTKESYFQAQKLLV